ncbi:dipeptidyl peptidase [Emydomyces testavorans]|uniref:Probable dipeptidyl-aminopeptidase B n=1 Tax=Emydomyces testavorans TaxID=2070801 RepID=A0AAF0DKE4_9EURO|nr:dipeptidyl peptidase [Emydomyces testavorans]
MFVTSTARDRKEIILIPRNAKMNSNTMRGSVVTYTSYRQFPNAKTFEATCSPFVPPALVLLTAPTSWIMGAQRRASDEEAQPLTGRDADGRNSIDSTSAASISLFLVDRANEQEEKYHDNERDREEGNVLPAGGRSPPKKVSIAFWLVVVLCIAGWLVAFFVFIGGHKDSGKEVIVSQEESNPIPGSISGGGKKLDLDGVLTGGWKPASHEISWFPGPNGEDGLLLEQGGGINMGYLRVEDIRSRKPGNKGNDKIVLMQEASFKVGARTVHPRKLWPSPDLKTVLVMSDRQKNWRHSYTGNYWLFNVETQTGEPLDPARPDARVQLASWSPKSDAVVFTRDNNMFIRKLSSKDVKHITTDGGTNLFYGIPDWVYEEEVFSGNSATWWAKDGKFVAFLRTNESQVPEYPVQYFIPSPGKVTHAGEEHYPDVRKIKYPKAGASNPVVSIEFFDVEKGEVFSVEVKDELPDDDRLIIEVIWASNGNVLVRETNRESDRLTVVLIDAEKRTGRVIRLQNVSDLDGGWIEPSQSTQFIPADPANGRPHDGYIQTIPHNGFNHLAYFTPLDNSEPLLLTSGDWEVVDAPSAVDLKRGLVYFVAAKEKPTERHIYTVRLDGSDLQPIVDTKSPAYYSISLSAGAGYALLKYEGPEIPWQKVINTPANEDKYEETIEKNPQLANMVRQYAIPSLSYQTIIIDGYTLQVVERRPPNFNPDKKYPVLFFLYGGPGSQNVNKKFAIDFQSYVASGLGYIVVTVDGRGTGFIGRKARCAVRDNLGHFETRDQIETAKAWGRRPYVDANRMAIWGWSYGGFLTLKTLEQDAGQTFKYGMAVAPVTDWRFYDSIYTERYMHTPQNNPTGYNNAAISNTTALRENVRFLVVHGSGDDNVHIQNTLTLLDKLDVDGVKNFDVHVFPDSDHSIYFHNAYKMVHQRLSDWLVNAFNGEWVKTRDPIPDKSLLRRALRFVSRLGSD